MSQPVAIPAIPLAPQVDGGNPSFSQLANKLNGPMGLVNWANSLTNWLNQTMQNIQTSLNNQVQNVGPTITAAATIAISNFTHPVTGTATITTITPPPGWGGTTTLVAINGFTLGTGGNIQNGGMIPAGGYAFLLWLPESSMWAVISETQVAAGTGVSVSTANGVTTIHNTGVTSVAAGSGASVSSSNGKVMVQTNISVGMKGDGTVLATHVPGSPVSTSGTLAPVLALQSGNTALMGPSSGGSSAPTFRNIVGADLPNPSASTLGGIESLAAVAHKWINQISTAGVPSATQPATTDLSDYTASTWTPTITTDGTAGTPAYTTHVGSYEQIGRLVIARFNLVLSGWTGSPTGNIIIAGLPVANTSTANNLGNVVVTAATVSSGAGGGISGTIATGATTFNLNVWSATGTSLLTATNTGTTPTLQGFCVYHT